MTNNYSLKALLLIRKVFIACVLCLLNLLPGVLFAQDKHHFEIANGNFLLDNKPFQIISGEMHYTRIPQQYWRDRIRKAKLMGLNTISTYVFWNVHEPKPGNYNFIGNNNIERFLSIAKEEGVWVILRPSPYVCAEWEFGGYPWWLLKQKGLQVRSNDPGFFNAYRKYILQLGKRLSRFEIDKGGPVLMLQVENEYGFYGSDKDYLAKNRDVFREAGFRGELYTCDIAEKVQRGHLEGLLPAINGMPDVKTIKDSVNKYHGGKGPYFISESYPGWYGSWGLPRQNPSNEEYLKKLDKLLAAGISVNFYMFHGGTTRAFMNGANMGNEFPNYTPQIASYDYTAPLDESGNITPKFNQFKQVISKYSQVTFKNRISKNSVIVIPPVKLPEVASIFNNLPKPVRNKTPLTFEDLNQGYGYVLYRTKVHSPHGILRVDGISDYAQVFVDQRPIGVLERRLKQDSLLIKSTGDVQIDILVENLGRLNSGPFLLDNHKGITGHVWFNKVELKGWEMYSFPFDKSTGWRFTQKTKSGEPVLRRGFFTLNKAGDTYLDMRPFGKGHVWINGVNLGRYWEIGPTQTIYVPGVWLKKGRNEIDVFEQLKTSVPVLTTLSSPILDQLKP